MSSTVLSSKGQVIIPKAVRAAHHWEAGQRLEVVDAEDGVLLKSAKPFSETTIDDVAACLRYEGKAKTLADMEQAISKGARESSRDRD